MGNRLNTALRAALIASAVAATVAASNAQTPSTYKGPRTSDGKPKLDGIWQALTTANWNLQSHNAKPGPFTMLGAVGAVPPGTGVVEGDEIPYQPWAAARKKENEANWWKRDPEVKCFLPGVPRMTYLPFPFLIMQTPKAILMKSPYADTERVIPIEARKAEPPIDSWMGEGVGKWDGDTLVVDTRGFNEDTWFDRAGNFHSNMLHVIERFTPVDEKLINYEATIEDQNVFTRPWKITMPLYRHLEKNAQLIEFKCVEFAEELLYGEFVQPGAPKNENEYEPK